jgi:hypothetical protein
VGRPWTDGTELIGARPSAALVLKGTGQGENGVGEPVLGLTKRCAVVRRLGDKAARWWSGVLSEGGCSGVGEEERRAGEGLVRYGILWGWRGAASGGREMADKVMVI